METGLREMQGLTRDGTRNGLTAGELDLYAKNGVAWVSISGKASNIFDLTHPGSLEGVAHIISAFTLSKAVRDAEKKLSVAPLRLITTAEDLLKSFMLENWRELPTVVDTPANSQLFGHLLSLAGFEAPSSHRPERATKTSCSFPDSSRIQRPRSAYSNHH